MNNFEGTNTGKWWVREGINGLYEAGCPVCDYCQPVAVNFDTMSLKMQVQGLEDFCPSCKEAMFKEDQLYTKEATSAFGLLDPCPKSLVIRCEKISLEQRSLGIIIDISENIDNIDTVEINGAKFVREV